MLLSSANRKYPPFPLLSYFSVVVYVRCLLHHILSLAEAIQENRKFVFIIIVQFMMSANGQMHFGLKIVFVCLYIAPFHYHHCANLSEDIELIKCLSDTFCRTCKIQHILAGCVCSVYPFPFWWLRGHIYTLSYCHHRIGRMNYYTLFSNRSWNNGVRRMSFCILKKYNHDLGTQIAKASTRIVDLDFPE